MIRHVCVGPVLSIALAGLAFSSPSFAGTKARVQNSKGCQAVLSAHGVTVGDSPFRKQLASLVAKHPHVRVSVSWGGPRRIFLFPSDRITHRVLPLVPFPRFEESHFEVLVSEPTSGWSDEDDDSSTAIMNARIFKVVPIRIDEDSYAYALKVNVSWGSFGGSDLELISLYAALSSAPYVTHLVIEHEIDPQNEEFDQEEAKRAVQFIRAAFVKGDSLSEALRGHEPKLVSLLKAQGAPFHEHSIELMGFKTNDRDLPDMVAPEIADEYTVEYGFSVYSEEIAKLFSGTQH